MSDRPGLMDFDFSDDQIALRDGAREVLDGLAAPSRVRAFTASDAPYDTALWSAMVEQGWLGVALPEAEGGLGFGVVEVALLVEEIGRHAAPAPFLATVLTLDALRRAEHHRQLAPLLDGTAVGCVAWSRRPDAVRAVALEGAGD